MAYEIGQRVRERGSIGRMPWGTVASIHPVDGAGVYYRVRYGVSTGAGRLYHARQLEDAEPC